MINEMILILKKLISHFLMEMFLTPFSMMYVGFKSSLTLNFDTKVISAVIPEAIIAKNTP